MEALSPDDLIQRYQEVNKLYVHVDYEWQNIFSNLCKVNDPRICPLILKALWDEHPMHLRMVYLGLLTRRNTISPEQWDIEAEKYLPPLLRRLQLGEELIAPLENSNFLGVAIAIVGGFSVLDTLIKTMGHESRFMRISARMGVSFLLREDDASLPYVIAALENKDIHIRTGAAYVLCFAKEDFAKIAFDQLIEGLQFQEFRFLFARWLGNVRDVRAAPALINILNDSSYVPAYPHFDWPIRPKHNAQEALRKMGDDVVPYLRYGLKHEDKEIRRMVVYTLGRIGTPTAQIIIRSLLKHPDTVLRNAAIHVINGTTPDQWLKYVYPTSYDEA